MTLNAAQRRVLEDWMRSKAILKCSCCGQEKWRLAEAAYPKDSSWRYNDITTRNNE